MEYYIRLFADNTAGLIDALIIDQAHVLGTSIGGYIAKEHTFFIKEADRFNKLMIEFLKL
jgi:pimeloyl-ACP methyl ester carboxylesterase